MPRRRRTALNLLWYLSYSPDRRRIWRLWRENTKKSAPIEVAASGDRAYGFPWASQGGRDFQRTSATVAASNRGGVAARPRCIALTGLYELPSGRISIQSPSPPIANRSRRVRSGRLPSAYPSSLSRTVNPLRLRISGSAPNTQSHGPRPAQLRLTKARTVPLETSIGDG
jgi:hypothetical protein